MLRPNAPNAPSAPSFPFPPSLPFHLGCMFIHLLSQRHRFELLDMSYHLLNIAHHEANSDTLKDNALIGSVDKALQDDADAFLITAQRMKKLNTKVRVGGYMRGHKRVRVKEVTLNV